MEDLALFNIHYCPKKSTDFPPLQLTFKNQHNIQRFFGLCFKGIDEQNTWRDKWQTAVNARKTIESKLF